MTGPLWKTELRLYRMRAPIPNYIKVLIDLSNAGQLNARYYFMLFSFFDNKKFIDRLYESGLQHRPWQQ